MDGDDDAPPVAGGAAPPEPEPEARIKHETKEERRVRLAREREAKKVQAEAKKEARKVEAAQRKEDAKRRRIAAGEQPADIAEEERKKTLMALANDIKRRYSSLLLLAQIPLAGADDAIDNWDEFKDHLG